MPIPDSELWILDRFLLTAERFTIAAYQAFRDKLLLLLDLIDQAAASLPNLAQ
jgi:hypothetical protein